MRKLKKWSLAAALVVSLAAGRAMAGGDDAASTDAPPPPKQSSFRWSPAFARMFQLDQPKPAPRKSDSPKKDAARKPAASKPAPPAVEPRPAERTRAEAALMRRLEVCDKLKEIALRSSDTELFHRAEILDERARAAYALHAGLSATADETTLDRHLTTTGKPSDRLASTATGGKEGSR